MLGLFAFYPGGDLDLLVPPQRGALDVLSEGCVPLERDIAELRTLVFRHLLE